MGRKRREWGSACCWPYEASEDATRSRVYSLMIKGGLEGRVRRKSRVDREA